MALSFKSREINRIYIIDDDDFVRSTLVDTVTDSNFQAVAQDHKVERVDQYLVDCFNQHDAVISDYQLQKKNYFPTNGAEVVSKCFDKGIPSILVTKYEPHIAEIRRFRQNIPVIINPEALEPETLTVGLQLCIDEMLGNFLPSRKLWRALVRVDGVDDNHVYIIIPSWDMNKAISLNKNDLPKEIVETAIADKRMHVRVNLGASSADDLYFVNWEQN